MKINSITSSNYVQNYRANKIGPTDKISCRNDVDQVTFSDDVINFKKMLSSAKDQIEICTAEEKTKINDIKNRIHQGNYVIDSELVAEKMLDYLV